MLRTGVEIERRVAAAALCRRDPKFLELAQEESYRSTFASLRRRMSKPLSQTHFPVIMKMS